MSTSTLFGRTSDQLLGAFSCSNTITPASFWRFGDGIRPADRALVSNSTLELNPSPSYTSGQATAFSTGFSLHFRRLLAFEGCTQA